MKKLVLLIAVLAVCRAAEIEEEGEDDPVDIDDGVIERNLLTGFYLSLPSSFWGLSPQNPASASFSTTCSHEFCKQTGQILLSYYS